MRDKVIYIDQWNFSNPPYGSGLAPLIRTSIESSKCNFIYAGLISNKKYKLGHIQEIDYGGNNISFFPLAYTNIRSKSIVPESIKLAWGLLKYRKDLFNISSNIFTRSYIVVWILSLFIQKFKICYYAPGLGNPFSIGRRGIFGKILSPLFYLFQAKSFNDESVFLAAASKNDIETFENKLKIFGFKKNIIYVPESVDINQFYPIDTNRCKEYFNLNDETIIFTFVGRLAKIKGIDLLIKSFKYYSERYPNSKFLIVGDGEERGSLEKLTSTLLLNDKIIFLGNCNLDVVQKSICASNSCLFGSYIEGFSFAMLEILACGKPIITTRVSGTDELIIEGKTGYIVDSRDPYDFYKKMVEIVESKHNFTDTTRKLVESNFTVSKQWELIKQNCSFLV